MSFSTPSFFRKKPITIQAMQFNGTPEGGQAINEWMTLHGAVGMAGLENSGRELKIETLEGTMTASAGDWVIRGVQGEFYPCKPDIFEQTYEKAA